MVSNSSTQAGTNYLLKDFNMAYRFTDTEKWRDAWFTTLTQFEMLLFLYLCDVCDIAGFAEVNLRLWAFELRSTESTIKGALEGLNKSVLLSENGDYVYLKNFLKHQKNLPLNERNNAHRGIIGRFKANLDKFIDVENEIDIELINSFIGSPLVAPHEGLSRGTGKGNGKGNGNGNSKYTEKEEKKTSETEDIKTKYELPDEFAEIVKEWFLYKKEIKDNYKSDRGRAAFVNTLKKLSGGDADTARQIINQSMANNWKGIFELKNRSNNGRQQQQSTITDEQLLDEIRQGMERGIAENARRNT